MLQYNTIRAVQLEELDNIINEGASQGWRLHTVLPDPMFGTPDQHKLLIFEKEI